jgi:hypothetical protein
MMHFDEAIKQRFVSGPPHLYELQGLKLSKPGLDWSFVNQKKLGWPSAVRKRVRVAPAYRW